VVKNGSKAHAVAAFRAGVEDYVDYPCSADELLRSIQAGLAQRSVNRPRERYSEKPRRAIPDSFADCRREFGRVSDFCQAWDSDEH
jgi:DNA-binding response OmpR family regulator